MQQDNLGMMHDACPAGAVVVANTAFTDPLAFDIQPFPIARFAFPAIAEPPESPAAEGPQMVWPDCRNPQVAAACNGTADAIVRWLASEPDASVCPLNRHAVIAITSPCDGDGKTSLLLTLAPCLAKRVAGGTLVVDANTGKPDLTARLALSAAAVQPSPQSTHGSARHELLVYPTTVARLSVLPASAGQRSGGFDPSLIDELREGWPLVLLDVPSLVHEEAVSLIGCCSGVYLAVRLGHTPRSAVARAARTIRRAGGRLLGCVVIQ
jgi:Mrp family chromosome partitioning ATPase